MQLGMALAKPTVSSSVSTASWIARGRSWPNGLYLPPSRPGRIGRTSSASGAARIARRASRPPERRDPRSPAASTGESCFSKPIATLNSPSIPSGESTAFARHSGADHARLCRAGWSNGWTTDSGQMVQMGAGFTQLLRRSEGPSRLARRRPVVRTHPPLGCRPSPPQGGRSVSRRSTSHEDVEHCDVGIEDGRTTTRMISPLRGRCPAGQREVRRNAAAA